MSSLGIAQALTMSHYYYQIYTRIAIETICYGYTVIVLLLVDHCHLNMFIITVSWIFLLVNP